MQRPQPEMPVVLIIEHRDAVYQRLAEDLYHAGFHVKRACHATEGIVQHFMFAPDLVVANVDLPDQSGWLLTAKLRITQPRPHVWPYKSRASGSDMAKARFLGAEELLPYNNPQQLSDAVFASLAGDTSSRRAVVGHGRICLDAVG